MFTSRLVAAQPDLLHFVQAALMAYPDDVWDVVQDTNRALIEHEADYSASRPFLAWVFAFAKKRISAFRQKKGSERLVLDDSSLDLYARSAFSEEADRNPYSERFRHLRHCLTRLPESQRETVDLHYLRGVPIVRIAERQGKPQSTVSMALFRARKALADCMKRLCRLEEAGFSSGEDFPGGTETEGLLAKLLSLPAVDPMCVAALFQKIKGNADGIRTYCEQTEVHYLLDEFGESFMARKRRMRRIWGFITAAACLALLLGGLCAAQLRQGKGGGNQVSPNVVESNRQPSITLAKPPEPMPELPPPKPVAVTIERHRASSTVIEGKQQSLVAKPPEKKEEKVMNATLAKVNTLAATATVAAAMSAIVTPMTALSTDDVPVVSGVTLRQPFNSRVIEIGYTLSNGPGIITVDITTNGVSIGDANLHYLAGEVNKVVTNGTYTVLWDTKHAWPGHTNEQARAVVTAWCTNCPPDVMVVDFSLRVGASAENPYSVSYYTSEEALPEGSVSAKTYKTTSLVLRKIHAGKTFWMGSSLDDKYRQANETLHRVLLTDDYYMGVYEFTQKQWEMIATNRPSINKNEEFWETRPVENISYNTLRGTAMGAGYPAMPTAVDATSFFSILRERVSGYAFDLPTEAQWEYACRAGTQGACYYDGVAYGADALNRLARNRGNCSATSGGNTYGTNYNTATVGSYLPNAFGLYDTLGNVWEVCKDWLGDLSSEGIAINPAGAENGTCRVIKGGSFWDSDVQQLRPSTRHSDMLPKTCALNSGFRICCPATAVMQ